MRLYYIYQTRNGKWVKYIGNPVTSLTGQIIYEDINGRRGTIARALILLHTERKTFPENV